MSKNALAFLIVGILLGALPGFLIGQSLIAQKIDGPDTAEAESLPISNPYPVPQSKAECYVAVAKATTKTGADIMIDYCDKKYGDF